MCIRDRNNLHRTGSARSISVSYTHLRAHETSLHLVCRLLLEKNTSSRTPRDRPHRHHTHKWDFLMIRRPPRSTHCISSAASDVYKRQEQSWIPFTQGCIVPSLVEIGLVVLEKKFTTTPKTTTSTMKDNDKFWSEKLTLALSLLGELKLTFFYIRKCHIKNVNFGYKKSNFLILEILINFLLSENDFLISNIQILYIRNDFLISENNLYYLI